MAIMNGGGSFPVLLLLLLLMITLCLPGRPVSTDPRGIINEHPTDLLPIISPPAQHPAGERGGQQQQQQQQQQQEEEIGKRTTLLPPRHSTTTTTTPTEPRPVTHSPAAESTPQTPALPPPAVLVPETAVDFLHELPGDLQSNTSTTGANGTSPQTPTSDEMGVEASPDRPLTPATAMLLLVAIVTLVGLLHFKVGAEIRRCWDSTSGCAAGRLGVIMVVRSKAVEGLKLAFRRVIPAAASCTRREDRMPDRVQASSTNQVLLIPIIRITDGADGDDDGDETGWSSVTLVGQSRV